MQKRELNTVTLLGIDCVNVERLQLVLDICEEEISFANVKLLTSLETDDSRKVEVPPINTIEAYSRFCISELVNYVNTEYVLLVQYDGFVLQPHRWNPDFLSYDYIGAPCSWLRKDTKDLSSGLTVGNGGFSLRSKKFLETSARLFHEGAIKRTSPEDVSLCVWHKDVLEKDGIRFAPVELAMRFSVQENYDVYPEPFGFHGLYRKNMNVLKRTHPDFPFEIFESKLRAKRGPTADVHTLYDVG